MGEIEIGRREPKCLGEAQPRLCHEKYKPVERDLLTKLEICQHCMEFKLVEVLDLFRPRLSTLDNRLPRRVPLQQPIINGIEYRPPSAGDGSPSSSAAHGAPRNRL